jgi:hypothetical protein
MKFLGLIILAGLLFLSGCATLNKEACLSGDWRGLGMKDGVNGESAARIEKHRKACAEHGVRPDEKLYMDGRAEGLREYCQIDNAFQSGLKGRQYQGVCPLAIHSLFLRYNKAAYEVHQTREEIKNKHDSISAAQNQLGNKKTSASSKGHIRRDIQKLESELDQLRNDLRDRERNLDEMMTEAREGKSKKKQEIFSHPGPVGEQVRDRATKAKSSAGKASGTLKINGRGIPLNYSYAMAQPNTFDAAKNDTAVLLMEKPLPEGALSGIGDLMDATRKQHGWAFFKINSLGKPIYEVIDHPATKGQIQMSGFTHANFVPRRMGKDWVEGTFATSNPKEFMTYKYEIKVEFSAPLLKAKLPEPLPNAKTGKALPAGGGAQGKAYNAYRKAIKNKDIAALRRTAPASQVKDMSDSDLEKMIDFMTTISPATPKITRGYVKGDRAVLYVEGIIEGKKQYGTVELAAKGKTWFIVHESWSNTPPSVVSQK